MSVRFTTRARGGLAAWSVAVVLAFGLVGCGGGGDDDKPEASSSSSKSSEAQPDAQEGDAEETLAELKGPNGLFLKVTAAQRDAGASSR